MSDRQTELINAVCHNKDIVVLMDAHAEELFGDTYQDVWRSMKSYYSKHRAVPDISILQEKFPSLEKVNVKGESAYYLDSLREEHVKSRLRRLLLKADSKLDDDTGPRVLEQLTVQLSKLSKFTHSVKDIDITDVDSAESHYDAVRARAEQMGGSPGIPTGIEFIDASYITGMAPGHLIVFIGWPGKGKTWLSSYVACNAFSLGFKPMIFSLEMTGENMRDRLYTIMGSGLFQASDFARGDIDIDNFRTFGKKMMGGRKGFNVVTPEGMNDVTPNVIQGKVEQYKPDLLILDYAQLMSDNRKTEAMTPRMMNLSREVKQLGVVNGIPVILITAATAEDTSDTDSPPELHKVAWSKAIEYDADLGVAVQYNSDSGLMEVVGRKNRHGELFDGILEWDINRGVVTEKFEF